MTVESELIEITSFSQFKKRQRGEPILEASVITVEPIVKTIPTRKKYVQTTKKTYDEQTAMPEKAIQSVVQHSFPVEPEIVPQKRVILPPSQPDYGSVLEPEELDSSIFSRNTSTPNSSDPLYMYVMEVSRYNLLTAEEEIFLAQQIETGGEEGAIAKRTFINANLRLVITIARKYQSHGLDFLELIQEGNIGLMTAVNKFDYTRGYKFSTYAYAWIKQSIMKALADKGALIRHPVYIVDDRIQINKLLGKDPTLSPQELAKELGMTERQVIAVLNAPIAGSLEQYSCRKNQDEEEQVILLPDLQAEDPLETIIQTDNRKLLYGFFENVHLSDRSKTVLEQRFGLTGEKRTLEEIAQAYGVTRERIRQIETKALEKLKQYVTTHFSLRQRQDFF